MKVNIFIVSILIILEVKTTVSAVTVTVTKQCNEVYSKTSYQYVPYEETYETKNWIGARKYKTRINYKYQAILTNHTRATCCPGFTEYGSYCRPFCSKNCGENGYCAYPEYCACDHGYTMDYQVDKCKPICMDECFNGYCAAPNTCMCKNGYSMLNGTCSPVCESCDINESCVEPHVCRCSEGYSRVPHSRLDSEKTDKCHPVCNRPCVNGVCAQPNVCHCNDGYGEYDGDEFTCEPRCHPKCVHGDCTAPNVCTCHDGFILRQNSTYICEPFCPKGCVNATCTAPGKCSCLDGYLSTDENHKCEPYCASGCEHGKCIAPEKCACDSGYEPHLIVSSKCVPVCTGGCHMGRCVAPNTCKCHDGYKFANGSISECVPSCKDDCTHGTCTAPDECTCDDGYEMANSTDGSTKCIVICECENGYCSDINSTCQSCLEGYELFIEGNTTSCKPRCEGGCENGQCVEPQKCECDEYYVADNDTLGNPICVHACGGECGHGSCSVDSGLCSCLYGWVGKHCDEPSVCSVAVGNQSIIRLQFNGNSTLEENENTTEIEEPWTGPICKSLCAGEINITSKCANQSRGEQSIFVCFLDINSPCNSYSVVQANTSTAKVNYTVLTTCIVILLLVITTLTIGMFIRKKRLEKSAEMKKSNQSSQRVEEDNLIENENDGISL